MRAPNHGIARALSRALMVGLAGGAMLVGASAASALEFARHASDSDTVNAIAAKGRVMPGDTAALEAYVARLPAKRVTVIYLNSPGGSLDEGMELGRYFHSAGIRTIVAGADAVCTSACSTAFLGGRDRETGKPWRAKGSAARLGFHSFRFDWPDRRYTAQDMSRAIARTQVMTLAMADYLKEVDAGLEFLRARLRAPAADMHYMSNEEALSLGLLRHRREDGRADPSRVPRRPPVSMVMHVIPGPAAGMAQSGRPLPPFAICGSARRRMRLM